MTSELSTITALKLKTAIDALCSLRDKWYIIGVQLDVPTDTLKNIGRDSMDPLCDTLDYWLSKVSSPSWRHLVDALRAPGVGENLLAEEVEEKYCRLEDQSSYDESEASIQVECLQGMYLYKYMYAYFRNTFHVGLFPASHAAFVTCSGEIIRHE